MKTIEFRDGEYDVPDHVAVMLTGIKCWELTREQAIRASEQKMLKDRLNDAQNKLVADFMKGVR